MRRKKGTVFLTIADCESEARRIHMIMEHFYRP
jgi:hypothetical protein